MSAGVKTVKASLLTQFTRCVAWVERSPRYLRRLQVPTYYDQPYTGSTMFVRTSVTFALDTFMHPWINEVMCASGLSYRFSRPLRDLSGFRDEIQDRDLGYFQGAPSGWIYGASWPWSAQMEWAVDLEQVNCCATEFYASALPDHTPGKLILR
jgi:hypothetical protein